MDKKVHDDLEYPGKIESFPVVRKFGTNRPVLLEVIYFESDEKQPYDTGSFFVSEVVARSDGRVQIQFRETASQELLPQCLIFSQDGEMRIEGDSTQNAGFNDFVADNYSEWCGKWHRGFGGKRWRICTGSDCNPGIAVCFQHELPNL